MRTFLFKRSQWVPRPRAEVFSFFDRPENLERMTPPDLGFVIRTPRPIVMRAGALLDYTVRPFGVPLRWRTLIESYDPPRGFVDVQLKGPYALWRHTHRFLEERGGTRMEDEVEYALPLGRPGALFAPLVERELERIFDYRRRAAEKLFPPLEVA